MGLAHLLQPARAFSRIALALAAVLLAAFAADFNGDGRPDLAGAGSNVRVALNAGDGSFRPSVEYPAGGYTQDVAAGDLNGDGRADLVVTNESEQTSLTVLLNNG